ncbi:hypothetical protein [Acanthopleuribacter pedis]|uniref:Uncharacterized protein n=1 Tax=Acanthopleuribacter pedis TaxID=442870 RepID=A0A8J7Q912_9BACT|nr:hypothetical protein [Acanthopleuribacter pedis]MBO1322657.1 hypothetical protein [Acanthopleuribacter pedis]
MAALYLPLAWKNSGVLLMDKLALAKNGDLSWKVMTSVCHMFRRVAVAELLLDGSKLPFSEHLGHGAQAWLHFLNHAPKDQRIADRGLGLFDAIAGGHIALAEAIARATPPEHNETWEYEDDYLYVRLIAEMFLGVMPQEDMEILLERWAQLLTDQDDFRYDLVALLLEEEWEQDDLNEGLLDAIDAMNDWLEEKVEDFVYFPEDEATLLHVSTEVLTWIYLLARKGMVPDDDYPLAPSLARVKKAVDPPADGAWMNIPNAFVGEG